ncbi:Uu.00g070390.m01.CDS01 [Anthostomella pinea]|uniref:Uu.00g070390.m01.CDS01 n=1 Tax=Anthostomella pinea TaxID=933095 RepID=A0AAI8VVH2_9PEZI|nr:Uu.00g070390.m01.CDS01 [Anthostomella pinea]
MPPLPGASPSRQPVHSDADFAHPSHPFALVVNVPLVDMTPRNGSTEVWLGTHNHPDGLDAQEGAHGHRASGRIKADRLAEWEAAHGGLSQPTIKKGSVIIRDLRLWHAGMPNTSGGVRVMLAMIHFANWYRNPMRLELAEDVRPVLEGLDSRGELGLDVPVDWVPKEDVMKGYLNRAFGNAYDFGQAP